MPALNCQGKFHFFILRGSMRRFCYLLALAVALHHSLVYAAPVLIPQQPPQGSVDRAAAEGEPGSETLEHLDHAQRKVHISDELDACVCSWCYCWGWGCTCGWLGLWLALVL